MGGAFDSADSSLGLSLFCRTDCKAFQMPVWNVQMYVPGTCYWRWPRLSRSLKDPVCRIISDAYKQEASEETPCTKQDIKDIIESLFLIMQRW